MDLLGNRASTKAKIQHFDTTKEQIQTAFEKLGFPANVRGETLTLKEFAALADEFAKF